MEPSLEGAPVGYFTPTYKLLKETYKDCIVALEPVISKKSDQEFIELITGGVIDFWSMDNPFAGRSRKYKRIIIDEAAFAKSLKTSWEEALRPTLTDLIGDAYFFSTPKGKNDFYDFYMKAQNGKPGDEDWMSFRQDTYCNPFMNHQEVEDARRQLPALAFAQEYLAEFNDNAANPFGAAFIEQCTFPLGEGPAVVYGVDLAKYQDWTVIVGLNKSGSVCEFYRFQKDWRQTLETIHSLPGPVKVDATGVGDPIVEELQRTKGDVTAFKFTQTSKQQIMEGLSVAIQQRKITFPEGHIKQELLDFQYQYSQLGVKYAARPGANDDCVCALALAYDHLKEIGTSDGPNWI